MADSLPTAETAFGPDPTGGAGQAGLPGNPFMGDAQSGMQFNPFMGESAPAAPLPSAEEAFGAAPPPPSGFMADITYAQGALGRIMHAFGQGAAQGWGTDQVGLSPGTEQTLKNAGLFNDYQDTRTSIIKSFNEALIRPAATAYSALRHPLDTLGMAWGATQGAVAQTGEELGQPALGRDIASIPEAFGLEMPGRFIAGEHVPTAGAPSFAAQTVKNFVARQQAPSAAELAQAKSSGIIGATDDGVWQGTAEQPAGEPDTSTVAPIGSAAGELHNANLEAQGETPNTLAPPAAEEANASEQEQQPPQPQPDIHQVARSIDPQTMSKYDDLTQRQSTYRRWLDELNQDQVEKVTAEAPHTDEITGIQQQIADLQARTQDATPRLQKKYAARLQPLNDQLADLQEKNQAYIDENTSSDSDAMARVRAALAKNDYALRDISVPVSNAYKVAAEQIGPSGTDVPGIGEGEVPSGVGPQDIVGATSGETSVSEQVQEQPAPSPEIISKTANTTEPAHTGNVNIENRPIEARNVESREMPIFDTQTQPVDIASDVSRQLQDAGRPAEESDLAAQLVKSRYEARADLFKGQLGTAEDLYARDFPKVVSAESGGPKGQAKGKHTILRNGQRLVTMFKKADASTFVHEAAHQWLDEMMKDAADERAPEQLRKDSETVRNYIGAKEGEKIADKSHEKFARAFENHLMEGRAPSQGLARVFDKFREWLSKIYQSAQDLKAPLNDNLRDAFDRLISTSPDQRRPSLIAEDREPFQQKSVKPENIMEFLADQGGLKDEGGELKAMDAHRWHRGKVGQRRLVHPDGLSLDEARERAEEQGFLRHGSTPNDLLDAIQETMAGNDRFRAEDEGQAQEWREHRRALNDRLRQEAEAQGLEVPSEDAWHSPNYDIDSSKLFADIHEADIEHAEPGDAGHESDRIEEEMDEWMRAEAPELYGEVDGNGRSSGQSSGKPTPNGDTGNAGRETGNRPSAGGGPGELEAVAGGGGEGAAEGSGLRASKRTLANPGERVTGANQPFDPNASEYIDKAGNVRLENLITTEDVKAYVREAAEQNGNYDNFRQVIPDNVRIRGAEAIAEDPAAFDHAALRKTFGNGDLSKMATALRLAAIQSGEKAHDLAKQSLKGGLEDKINALQAAERHAMIMGTLNAATNEAGRLLRSFHDMNRSLEYAKSVSSVIEKNSGGRQAAMAALNDVSGRSLYQLDKYLESIASMETPAQVSKYIREQAEAGAFDWALSSFINNLISGPLTHAGYTAAQYGMALYQSTAEVAGAAAVHGVRKIPFLGNALNKALGIEGDEGAHLGESLYQLYGLGRGTINGAVAGYKALKANAVELPKEVAAQEDLPGIVGQPLNYHATIPGMAGKILESPGRMVAALHTFNWTVGYSRSISAQAYRMVMADGGKDLPWQQFGQRVAQLEQKPTRAMIDQAAHEATEGALMSRPEFDSLMGNVSRITNYGWKMGSVPLPGGKSLPLGTLRPVKFIDPFVQISAASIKMGIGRGTPLEALNQTFRDDIMGKNGAGAFDRAAGRLIAGSALTIGAMGMAFGGHINASGPSDPKSAIAWRRIYGQPHGFNVGGVSFDLLRLGPLGLRMSVAADLAHAVESGVIEHNDFAKVGADLVHSFTANILDESFAKGISDAMEAATNPQQHGQRWISGFVKSFVPFSVGLGQAARQVDPYTRQASDTWSQIKAGLPFVSETLPPRVDIWGQPIPNRGWAGTYYEHTSADPVERALFDAGVYPSMAQKTIKGVKLSDEQYHQYASERGKIMKMIFNSRITPSFPLLPHQAQIEVVQQTEKEATRIAETHLMMNHHEIISQAQTDQKALLQSGARKDDW